ncbi:MAG: hypothetical protein QOJ72_1671 [Nocardioidaceae bacterium]|jgi:sugar lactone lactonase YvrE|nr:hypothetical protein [Nocardioidaceae bacterium]
MKTLPRALAAVTGLALASLTISAAQAADVNAAPTRWSNSGGEFASGAGFARAQSVAVTSTGARVYVGSTEGTGARVVGFTPNVNNANAYVSDSRLYGTKSGLASSYGLTMDRSGRLWTADPINKTVSRFAASAVTGNPENSTPQLTISGPNTGLEAPTDVAFAPNGDVLVTDNGSTNRVLRVYAADGGGNTAPKSVIDLGFGGVTGVAVDSKGLIYVANAGLDSIQVYAAGATTGASAIRTIAGPDTALHTPTQLAIDSSDNLYVANRNNGAIPGGTSVAVFAPGADDDAAPIARLTGPSTTLDHPNDVALDADRNVYVVGAVDPVSNSLLTKFAPLVPFTVPSAARSISVSGSSKSSTRKISWHSPTNTGGTPITKYKVLVKHGSKTIYNKTTTSRSYTVKRSTLSNGTNTVTITAVNKVGNAPGAKKSFTVKK